MAMQEVSAKVRNNRRGGSSNHSCHYAARSSIVAKLAKVNALPCAEIQSAAGDGNSEGWTYQAAFGVSRHVIASFQRMQIVWFVLFHQAIHDLFHITTDIRVRILVDGKSAGRVFDKKVQHPCIGQWLRQMAQDLTCDKMKAPASCFKCKFCLLYHCSEIFRVQRYILKARLSNEPRF